MRVSWRALGVVLAAGVSRCTCAPPCSNHSGPHATWDLAQGCAGYYCQEICDPGWADCGDNDNGCTTSTTTGLPPHTFLDTGTSGGESGGGCGGRDTSQDVGTIGACTIECNSGFFDCDHDPQNGCETESIEGCAANDAQVDSGEPASAHRIAVLNDPRGLVVCAGLEIVFDGSELRAIDSVTRVAESVATSPAPPVDGLTCDGSQVYWTTFSDSDATTPNSALYSVSVHGGTPSLIQSGFDARSGVDLNDAGIFLMTGDGLKLSSEAGLTPWMPATPTGAYKPFTLTETDIWSIADASIYRRGWDASASSWIDDAGVPTVLASSSSGPIAARHVAFDDAGPTSDELLQLVDDAGDASLASFAAIPPVVASTSRARTIIATDDTIYLVEPPNVTSVYTTSDHIVDVAVDGTWIVWTTRGSTVSPAGVWRGQLP